MTHLDAFRGQQQTWGSMGVGLMLRKVPAVPGSIAETKSEVPSGLAPNYNVKTQTPLESRLFEKWPRSHEKLFDYSLEVIGYGISQTYRNAIPETRRMGKPLTLSVFTNSRAKDLT